MSVDISCGKCGEKISTMQMLKSIKDVLKHGRGDPPCGVCAVCVYCGVSGDVRCGVCVCAAVCCDVM